MLTTTPAHVSDTEVRLLPMPGLFRTNAFALGHDGVFGRGVVGGVFRKVTLFVDDDAFGGRVWHLCIVMAAKALGFDLAHASIRPGQIILTNAAGVKRTIPVDGANRLYIDWSVQRPLCQLDDSVVGEAFAKYYVDSLLREAGHPNTNSLAGRLVLIGYAAAGRGATDWGPTPLGDRTPLYLSHLAVANGLLTDRFIHRTGAPTEYALIVCLAVAAAVSGWRLRPLWGVGAMICLCVAYCGLACWL